MNYHTLYAEYAEYVEEHGEDVDFDTWADEREAAHRREAAEVRADLGYR